MRRFAILLAPVLAAAWVQAQAQTAPAPNSDSGKSVAQLQPPAAVTDCDLYAASDFDIQSPVLGTPFNRIDPKLAIPACIEALSNDPNSARLNFQLGRTYDANKEFEKALEFFQKAAAANFALAEVNLGSLYFNGQGAIKDLSEAAKWDRLAADQGLAPAQANLGAMYLRGQGVAQDYAEAAKLIRAAALQGFAPAQNNLAALYASGKGVGQDFVEAARLYRQAADQGYAPAEANLGALYANGQGVERSYSEAKKWYGLAAAQGYEAAQTSLDPPKPKEQRAQDGTPGAVASVGEGYPPVRIVVKQLDNRDSSGIPTTAIEVSPLSTSFAMTSFSVNKGQCRVFIEDPTAFSASGADAQKSAHSQTELQAELAKISLTPPPFDPPVAARLGQYMQFFTDPSVCDIKEVEVTVNGSQWTWPQD
jgi:TPR repeat protein